MNFRFIGYNKQKDYSFILDSNGMYQKPYEFTKDLLSKGIEMIDIQIVCENIYTNIPKASISNTKYCLRDICKGKITREDINIDGNIYRGCKINLRYSYKKLF